MISLPTVNGKVAGYAKFFSTAFKNAPNCHIQLPVVTWFNVIRDSYPPVIGVFNALWNVTEFNNQASCKQ
jgi:hypothetical protein